ncbi:MAG: Acyltransferase 3 [Cellvibrio sp.]|jgi:peptidoglycan/LPS O-acetylase OafA/YrhL|nr:Acyltransferase 3 [Cellvibrio sp.]
MHTSEGNMSTPYRNSFDVVRHIAALMVLVSHQFALSGLEEPSFLSLGPYGLLGVAIFFVISGYLVAESCLRSENFASYMEKRIRRIFPALIVCCFLLVFTVVPFFTPADLWTYFTSSSTYTTFINGTLLLGLRPKDIFTDFIYPTTINGSLWTLPYEFFFYIIIGTLIISMKDYKAPLIVFFISAIIAAYTQKNPIYYHFYTIRFDQNFKFLMIFSFGSLLAFTEQTWNKTNIKVFLSTVSILVLITQYKRAEFFILGNLAISFLVIAYAVSFKDHIIKHRFDISYGVYIYAFPVQQIVINKLPMPFLYSLLVTCIITSMLALLSWFFVEKRFLNRG